MSKEHATPTNPEEIAHSKAAILAQWQRLPSEAQVAVLAEQLKAIADSEAAASLREALRIGEAKPDPLHEIYPITGVSRADLQERLHYSAQDIQELADQDMREIAGKLEDGYVELELWNHVGIVTDEVLAQKRRLSAQP